MLKETETDGEDCGECQPARGHHPDGHPRPDAAKKTSYFSETEFTQDNWPLSDCEPETENSDTGRQKQFCCDVCGSRFLQKGSLKAHRRIHTGEKPFGCDICGKQFSLNHHLKTHMTVHTGERPYGCDDCGKQFSRNHHLKSHLRVHTGERPYGCHVCGKQFSRNHHLKSHLRVHTGERPYGCDVCGKLFTSNQSLKMHLGLHKQERPFVHDICDVQQLSVINEEDPDWSLSTVQQDPEPPHTDEEQEELWIGQEAKQVNRLHEAGIIRFPFTAATMMSEDDEDKHQSSQLHQSQINGSREAEPQTSASTMLIETETDGEDCGEYEPARGHHPDRHPRPDTAKKTSYFSETEFTQDNWQEPLSDCEPETENSDTGREKQFSCALCGSRFVQKGQLKIHMRIHTGEKPFGCDICGKRYSHSRTLKIHLRVHTGEKPYGCDDCGKQFSRKESLQKHLRVHTGERPYGCHVCGKQFSRNHHLKSHLRVHTGERPYGCDVCGKLFTSNQSLKMHLGLHKQERPFVHDICDVQQLSLINEEGPDWSLSTVQQHPEPPHTDEEQEELWIGQEGKQFNRLQEAGIIRFPFTAATMMSKDGEGKPQSSKLHQSQIKDSREAEPQTSTSTMLKETETNGEDCGECEPARDLHPDRHPRPDAVIETSDSSENEFAHDHWQEPLSDCEPETENSDTGRQKQFCCDICNCRFPQQSRLKAHMRVHTEEKPFGCDVCGKQFSQKQALKKHLSIHTREKPFGCDICGKRFSQSQYLKIHLRVHTGERPFPCGVCGKLFTQSQSRKIHLRVHTGEKPFDCDICGKLFSRKDTLKLHMKVHTVTPVRCGT